MEKRHLAASKGFHKAAGSRFSTAASLGHVEKRFPSASFHTLQNFFGVPAVAYLAAFLFVANTICAYLKSCGIYSDC